MEIKIEEIKQLIQKEYRGNQTWFAEDIGINSSYLNEILNMRKSAKWCEKKKKNYKDYIIFLI